MFFFLWQRWVVVALVVAGSNVVVVVLDVDKVSVLVLVEVVYVVVLVLELVDVDVLVVVVSQPLHVLSHPPGTTRVLHKPVANIARHRDRANVLILLSQ